MSPDPADPTTAGDSPPLFPLRSGRGALVLDDAGLRRPRWPRWLGSATTPYREITHLAVGPRGFRLATRRAVHSFPRSLFADAGAPEELARALVERMRREPDGAALVERMWEVEKLSARPRSVRVAPVLAALCVAVFLGEQLLGPPLFLAGLFSATLLEQGDWWRLVTGNFLHGGFGHLALNALGLFGIGALVERILGPLRTGWIFGLGALGGMGGGWWAAHEMAVGASGMVFALVGALVWLELRWGARLPASWRVPRVLLLGALAADAGLSVAIPGISMPAHTGGFFAGMAACAAVAGAAVAARRPAPWLWAADGALALGLAASLAAAGAVMTGDGSLWARHARPLLSQPQVDALTLNNYAWMIATGEGVDAEERTLAVELARRAVEKTEHRDPNILDTLAEALFQAGRPEEAVEVIDEAIALAPEERYFREQRRRFTGERPPDDRPEPPGRWIGPQPREDDPAPTPPEPGIQV